MVVGVSTWPDCNRDLYLLIELVQEGHQAVHRKTSELGVTDTGKTDFITQLWRIYHATLRTYRKDRIFLGS